MEKIDIVESIKRKEIDIEKLVDLVIEDPKTIPELAGVVKNEKGSIKFSCEKILRSSIRSGYDFRRQCNKKLRKNYFSET